MPSSLSKYFPPPNWETLLRYYLPVTGAASYVVFSAHCVSPTVLGHLFPTFWYPVSLGVWFNSHLGIGLFYWHRKHLRRVADISRTVYSVYTTVLFNFGSVLFWSAVSDILPKQKWIRVSFGLLVSVSFLLVGREYLAYVDSLSREVD